MRKKLIAAILIVLILLAAAVAAVLYMEGRLGFNQPEQTTPGTSEAETTLTTDPASTDEAPEATTEPVVEISLPTEDPNDVTPEVTFDPNDTTPPETIDPEATQDPDATEDPDENALPEMDF